MRGSQQFALRRFRVVGLPRHWFRSGGNSSGDDAGVNPGSSSGFTFGRSWGGSSSCGSGFTFGGSSGSTSSSGSGTVSGSGSGSSSGGTSTAAPTWSTIYRTYLAAGTVGNCTSCHAASSASNFYSWLQSSGYVGGSNPALTNSSQSCLSWYGGNMPPHGPSTDAQPVADMNAWAAAGGLNN